MEVIITTFKAEPDELALIAELLQKEIKAYAALQTMPNVINMTAAETVRYDMLCNLYNYIIGKL